MNDYEKFNVKAQQIRQGRQGKILVQNVLTHKNSGQAICWDYAKKETVLMKCSEIAKKYDLIN